LLLRAGPDGKRVASRQLPCASVGVSLVPINPSWHTLMVLRVVIQQKKTWVSTLKRVFFEFRIVPDLLCCPFFD
jgi:hypothetical protein